MQLMVDEVSGQDSAGYMRARVLEPLGMESSDYGWTERVLSRAASPHDGEGRPIDVEHFTALAVAGLRDPGALPRGAGRDRVDRPGEDPRPGA